jgi:hypothetical protein
VDFATYDSSLIAAYVIFARKCRCLELASATRAPSKPLGSHSVEMASRKRVKNVTAEGKKSVAIIPAAIMTVHLRKEPNAAMEMIIAVRAVE